jgi:hypothetical protein
VSDSTPDRIGSGNPRPPRSAKGLDRPTAYRKDSMNKATYRAIMAIALIIGEMNEHYEIPEELTYWTEHVG